MGLSDGLSLLFKIRADGDQARKEISSLSTTVSKELRQIETSSKGATSGLGGLGSGISSLISPANLLAGAGIAAGAAVFALGKQALDAAGQLFDLSQKTNFAVETLSALKNAGETSGTGIESLSAALGIFDKNIDKAASGNKELEATFQRLNISTTDNEQALRDAFRALSQMDEGAQQTATAMELFGRSGKDVLGVIKETNGDLDKAIAKYREMGTLISTETARSADELGDSITALGQSVGALALNLVTALGPALKAVIGALGLLVTVAQAAAWALKQLFAVNIHDARPLIAKINETAERARVLSNAPSAGAMRMLPGGALGMNSLRRPEEDTSGRDYSGGAAQTFRMPSGGGGGGGRSGGGGRAARPEKGPDDFGADLLRNLKEQITSLATTEDAMGKVAAQVVNLERLHGTLGTAIHGEVIEAAQRLQQLQQEIKLRNETKAFITRQDEAVRQLIEGDKSEFEKVGELIESYKAQGRELRDHITLRLQLNALLLDSGRLMTDLSLINAEAALPGGGEGTAEGGIGAAIEAMMGGAEAPAIPAPNFDAWKAAVADVKDMTVNAFGSMADAMGAAIQAWVLYGAEGGQSIKKVMASILAALAAEAAVKAIFQLAEGFAKLAGFMPGPAALHFKAAAMYGAIAVTAGVAGRALAGNSFATGGGASGGGAGGSSGQAATQANKPTPIDTNRTAGEQRIIVDIRTNDAYIIDVATKNIRQNGKLRTVLSNETLAST